MPWTRNWLKFVPETSYGEAPTEGAEGTATGPIYIRLHQDNAFTMADAPYVHAVRSADALNRRILAIGAGNAPPARYTVTGSLKCYGYADNGVAANPFTQDMLDAALKLTSGDLGSYALTHWDGVRARQWLGVKVKQLKLACASTQDEGALMLDISLVGQKFNPVDPSFAEPTPDKFPTLIYNHRETAGALTLGSVRTFYKSLSLTVNNDLATPYDENPYISSCTFVGRTIDWDFAIQFRSKTDRDNWEQQNALDGEIVFNKATTPAHALTLTLNAANYIASIDRDQPLGGIGYETLHLSNFVDPAATPLNDIAYSAT